MIEIAEPLTDYVAPDALQGIPRQQTNPSRWQGKNWIEFIESLKTQDITVHQAKTATGIFGTDAGGMAYGLPHGVIIAESAQQISNLLKAAQTYAVPVTTRGGGLTTEGESIAFGGILLDMTGMNQVLKIDKEALTVRVQGGIFWHSLAEHLRRQDLDYLSAPLNFTSTVGGTLGVGGIDVNSSRLGCSADQALSLQVVTPTGDIVECSDMNRSQLFQRVILGYGQFGVITEVTLKIRPYTPLRMHYFYYNNLRTAIQDLQVLDKKGICDYTGILTMMDKAITLLVAFDSKERETVFQQKWRSRLRGYGELVFTIKSGFYYMLRPWRWSEALFLFERKRALFPDLKRPEFMRNGKMLDRTVVFSRAVWKHWGGRQMIIPDLSTRSEKFVEAVERGNAVCKQYFKHYVLYCVGIKLRADHKAHYEMSCIPPDAEGWAYGCEFEPLYDDETFYSRDYLQSFKNAIYDIGVDMGSSYYRFGGMMKGYIRRIFGNELVDKHLVLKRKADPAMILNKDVIF